MLRSLVPSVLPRRSTYPPLDLKQPDSAMQASLRQNAQVSSPRHAANFATAITHAMKQRFERRAIGFARRTGIVLLNLLFNHRLFYRTLGWLNERFDFLASVFVAYPASAKYAKYYFSPSINQKFEWSPALCALLHQNGKWTLGFGISSSEQDFRDSSNEENLQALVE